MPGMRRYHEQISQRLLQVRNVQKAVRMGGARVRDSRTESAHTRNTGRDVEAMRRVPGISCLGCGSWEITPERGRDIGICLAGRGETLADEHHPKCFQPAEPKPEPGDAALIARARAWARSGGAK